jgi:thymidylate kinase
MRREILLIIIEGSDAAGKSTYAALLADSLRAAYPGDTVEIWKKGPPSEHPLVEYEHPLYDYRPSTRRHIICDRWHVGEYVYPPVLGRSTSADSPIFRHIDLFLQSRGALVVYLDPGYTETINRLVQRGDDLVQPEMIRKIRKRYDNYLHGTVSWPETLCAVQRITRDFASALTVESTITRARRLANAAARLNPYVTYVGPPAPSYLILGDIRHALSKMSADQRRRTLTVKGATIPYGPTFGPYRSTSGHYLLGSIPDSLWQRGVGLANACDVDNPRHLHETLGRPATVAVGANAWKVVRDMIAGPGDLLGAVPHPQYIRRFHHGANDEYRRVIEDAATYGKNLISWRP